MSHFDAHHLKKSILNTIFQAVKAITGGITAINGQLIKGSGYAISAGGQVSVLLLARVACVAAISPSDGNRLNVSSLVVVVLRILHVCIRRVIDHFSRWHAHARHPYTLVVFCLQLVAKSGDAVSNVGKKIALSAELVEPHSHKYPTSGGGGGSAAGIQATIAKLISGSSGASSGGSSGGHTEVEHHGHVEGKLNRSVFDAILSSIKSIILSLSSFISRFHSEQKPAPYATDKIDHLRIVCVILDLRDARPQVDRRSRLVR